ncbi:iron complex outermembrane recepter protein [Pedobacter westerhofensis]|uniref:Iron complex outermembrane recepter protein n=1 Tax=Pedobacter westerhofensis TaxID=425512 RepID=A0A521CYR5_9SPHI|nr:TonB-dependent receptor [Pedobacter westerhofensis]SMO64596.1 iron complex outermembrane recepter protein [Pedobacter westerhofensis]
MMKNLQLSLFILLVFSLVSLTTVAQSVKVQGIVKDENGFLPFATIKIGRTSNNADAKGLYGIYLSAGVPVTLKISSAGYQTLLVNLPAIQRDTTINWKLEKIQNDLDEVVVSATRRPEQLRNITSSVTVISRKKLENEIAINPDLTAILANQVPGIAPSAQSGSNVGQNLRGRPMLVMIDGVSQSSPLRNAEVDLRSIDPSVLQQVEVVKGATAIYGNGAAGGLVNYITLVPDTAQKFAGKTDISYNGSLVKLKNSAGGRISQMFYGKTNKFDYVLSGVAEQTGEYRDAKGDIVGPNYSLGETDSYNAFAKIGYQPTKNQRLQLVYNFYSSLQHSNYTLINGNLATGQKATGKLGAPAGIPTGNQYNHNLHFSYKLDSLFLKTSLTADAYYENREDVFYVSAGRFDGGDGQSLAHNDKKGARIFLQTPIIDHLPVTANLAYGLDFLRDKTSQPLVDGRVWVPTMDMTNLAPFVQADVNLFRNLIFKTGFRYEHVNIDVDDYQTLRITGANGATVTPSINVTGGALKYNTALFNAGFKYNKLPLFSPFVSYSQGFSVMDIGLALRDARASSIDKINTDAVRVNNYELGFESSFKGLKLTASAYRSTSKLGIEVVYDPATTLYNTNRSPENIYGYELAANFIITPSLNISGSYSYTEGKRDVNGNGKYNDPEDLYLNGRRISAPKITGSINYLPLRVLDLTLNYTGIMKRDRFEKNATSGIYNGNEGVVEPYNLFSFAAGFRVNKNTRLSLGIDNLFNEDYFPARAQWFMQPGFYSKGRGRAVNLGLSVRY